ncbi:MAG TPA: hypothetical protein VHN14_32190 [Kofleriaceae bacterium]|jgi:hypothetical protein|nr:hypothetical protein [Kofleriaceae bacterium]
MSVEELVQDIRVCLLRAVDDGRITSPRNEIWAIKATPGESKRILITGGEKDYRRDKSRKHFAVEGGAWFDFAITVEMSDAGLSLYSYNFEIRFGAKLSPAFLRFDLNSPVHDNAALGFRSHLHPGTDDWSVPAAILTPIELIDLFTYGIFERRRRGRTKATSRKRSARS